MQISDNIIHPGMNVTKCQICGYDKSGHVRARGGNVFVPVTMERYAIVRHDGSWKTEAKCTNGHTALVTFVYPLAPQASEENIRELQKLFGRIL